MTDENRETQGAQTECVEAAIARNLSTHRSYYDQWLSSRREALQNEVSEEPLALSHSEAHGASNVLMT